MKLISNSHTTVIEQCRLKGSINESALSPRRMSFFCYASVIDRTFGARSDSQHGGVRECLTTGETCVCLFFTCLDVCNVVLMHIDSESQLEVSSSSGRVRCQFLETGAPCYQMISKTDKNAGNSIIPCILCIGWFFFLKQGKLKSPHQPKHAFLR